jgi:predicted O-methyltransferase YrrM
MFTYRMVDQRVPAMCLNLATVGRGAKAPIVDGNGPSQRELLKIPLEIGRYQSNGHHTRMARSAKPECGESNDCLGTLLRPAQRHQELATKGDKSMLTSARRVARYLTGATVRELRALVASREGRIRDLEVVIEQVAEEARANSRMVTDREARIRELESEIGLVVEEARSSSATAVQRERRIGELEDEIKRVVKEARSNITDRECRVRELEDELQVLNTFAPPWHAAASPEDRAVIAWKATAGWCTEEKARWLAALVTKRRVTSALEIGVFGGKSLLPIAAAMTCRGGVAYGVEPWSREVSIAEPTSIHNDLWWTSVDMRVVKSKFYVAVARLGLASQVRMLELSSDEAQRVLAEKRFQLIHIDGSHAPGQSLRDVKQWSPLLSTGGVLVLDDVCWPSLKDARAFVEDRFKLLEIRHDAEGSYAAYVQQDSAGL